MYFHKSVAVEYIKPERTPGLDANHTATLPFESNQTPTFYLIGRWAINLASGREPPNT